jgi:hypothetical protein
MRAVHVALVFLLASCFSSPQKEPSCQGNWGGNFGDGGWCILCGEPDMSRDMGVHLDASDIPDMIDSDALPDDGGTTD